MSKGMWPHDFRIQSRKDEHGREYMWAECMCGWVGPIRNEPAHITGDHFKHISMLSQIEERYT